jgi:nucleoside-diphosphate-sugar epimerase
MKILVTGAKGFVGKNLCWALKNIKDGKDRRFPELAIEAVYEYDLDSTPEELDTWCKDCGFVFNLAGVNRPKDTAEFMAGNFGFASTLLNTLKKYGNTCPVMLSSSIQATLAGRFGTSEYGKSKKAGEELFFDYSKETGAKVLVYRFPNLFGKWCRPNYNSAVATFCNAFANDLPYTVNDPSVELELLQILCAVLLTSDEVKVSNVPDILDVRNLIGILIKLGVKVKQIAPGEWSFQAGEIDLDYAASMDFVTGSEYIIRYAGGCPFSPVSAYANTA